VVLDGTADGNGGRHGEALLDQCRCDHEPPRTRADPVDPEPDPGSLRSALNAAIREGLLGDNPARYIEVPSPRRPHALVWTAQRVEAWQETGERPAGAGAELRAQGQAHRDGEPTPPGVIKIKGFKEPSTDRVKQIVETDLQRPQATNRASSRASSAVTFRAVARLPSQSAVCVEPSTLNRRS
jgi:hypothetical protein